MISGLCVFSLSVFLGKIKDAFDRNPELQNLLLDDFFKTAVEKCQVSFQGRKNIKTAIYSLNFCTLFPSQFYLNRKMKRWEEHLWILFI